MLAHFAQVNNHVRAKTIQERLDGVKKYVCLKLPCFFNRLYGKEKSAVISKLTYILTPSSRSYIVLALILAMTLKGKSFEQLGSAGFFSTIRNSRAFMCMKQSGEEQGNFELP